MSVYEAIDTCSPEQHASKLLYLGNASTIRSRVMGEYGRAPSIERIEQMLAPKRKEESARERARIELVEIELEAEREDHEATKAELAEAQKRIRELEFQVSIQALLADKNRDQIRQHASRLLPREIIKVVASEYGLTVDDILARGRAQPAETARHICVAILMARGMSASQAARSVGRKDHTTATNSQQAALAIMERDAGAKQLYDDLTGGGA